MFSLDIPTLIAFLLYILLMLYIGVYFYKKNDNLNNYILGDRNINPLVTAISAGASDMSAWLFLGLPGSMYLSGIRTVWIAVGLTIGSYMNWLVVSKRLRVYTELTSNSVTIPDYFENRFEDKSGLLKFISALVILFFFTIYIAAGLVGGAKLFEGSFGVNYYVALYVGASIIVFYTFLGGYKAVCWTDFVQGLLMLVASVIVPFFLIYKIGGLDNALSTVKNISSPDFLNLYSNISLIGMISLIGWGLGYSGQPHILVRFMSIKDPNKLKLSRRVSIAWMALSMIGVLLVGFFALAYLKYPLKDPEQVFISVIRLLFYPFIAGILLAAILAAIMSTVSSQLLVSSSAVVKDFYQKISKKDVNQKRLVFISRVSVLLIFLVALYIASNKNSKVLTIVSYAWGGFGASFSPLIIISLLWKGVTRNGAITGIIVGAIVVVVWKNLSGGIFNLYEIVPGFIFSSISIILVSLMGIPPKSVIEKFDQVRQKLKK